MTALLSRTSRCPACDDGTGKATGRAYDKASQTYVLCSCRAGELAAKRMVSGNLRARAKADEAFRPRRSWWRRLRDALGF